MEPFDKDDLTDRELDTMLSHWKAPAPPARLKSAVFGERRLPWWQRLWTASIRVPLPVACALLLALVAGFALLGTRTRVVVRTERVAERVEVPVIQERVVYRDRPAMAEAAWRPVRELRPRIIRGNSAQ